MPLAFGEAFTELSSSLGSRELQYGATHLIFHLCVGLRLRGSQSSRQADQLSLMRLSVLCLAAMTYMMGGRASVTIMGR
jgi:hypothetical protein